MPDLDAPAEQKALKFIGKPGGPVGGGLAAGDYTADQAHEWLTQGQVKEALDLKSHKIATKDEADVIEKTAAQTPRERAIAARRAVKQQQEAGSKKSDAPASEGAGTHAG